MVNWAQIQEQHHQYLVPLVFNNDDFASARKSLIYPHSFVRGCREISSRFARRRGFCPRSRKPRGAWPLGGFRVIDADHFFRVHRLFTRELQYLRAVERSSSSVEIAVNSSTQLVVWRSLCSVIRDLLVSGDLSAVRVKARFFATNASHRK